MEYVARARNAVAAVKLQWHAVPHDRGDLTLFVASRAARVGARRCVDFAPALGQRLAQQPLDLAVDAAQFLSRQRLDRGGDRRIEAQQEGLS